MIGCRQRVVVWGPVVVGLCALAAGCSGRPGSPSSVSGKVTVDGQPFAEASILFHATGGLPAEYRTATATTDAKGQYAIAKIYPGTYEVLVGEKGGGPAPADPGSLPAMPKEELRPIQGGTLEATIGKTPTTFDIQLTKKTASGGK